jgi:hypothetical protein
MLAKRGEAQDFFILHPSAFSLFMPISILNQRYRFPQLRTLRQQFGQ